MARPKEKLPLVDKLGGPASAPSNLAVVGRYFISPEIFPMLGATRPGRGGEIQLTDALNQLAQSGALYACETRARRYDVGNSRPGCRAAVSGDD